MVEEKRAANVVRKRRVLEVIEVQSVRMTEGGSEQLQLHRGVKGARRSTLDESEEEWEK